MAGKQVQALGDGAQVLALEDNEQVKALEEDAQVPALEDGKQVHGVHRGAPGGTGELQAQQGSSRRSRGAPGTLCLGLL